MATTTPDNIRTPDSGDQYALVQDLGVLADTVQNALTRRGNLYVGTSAQRVAFTADATDGMNWQDIDGQQLKHVFIAGAWVPRGEMFYAGTGAQRAAFAGAPNGAHWQDTDDDQLEYVRLDGAWAAVGEEDTGWISMSGFSSSFTTQQQPAYRRIGKEVFARGSLVHSTLSGTIATGFVFPSGFRPSQAGWWNCSANSSIIRSYEVAVTGALSLYSASASSSWANMTPINFIAAD